MILVLGGTTEGRRAAEALEEAGTTFYYSTRGDEQEVALHNGKRLTGAMDTAAMTVFCRDKGIRLIVDAAHPFATMLHHTAADAARAAGIGVVRYERVYPDTSERGIVMCDGYDDAVSKIKAEGFGRVLALTGVQTIGKLKALWQSGTDCRFRILDRDSSRQIAAREGFPPDRLCYYRAGGERRLMEDIAPDAIVTKESGVSGGFMEKVEAAEQLGIRVLVIRRPELPQPLAAVDGPHGLRREIERLLPEFYPLHSGLTTGTCATAAAVAAVYGSWGKAAGKVPVRLPDGETIEVEAAFDNVSGKATVIKTAGDDPDITDGTAICAAVDFEEAPESSVDIRGGEGVGTVTLPGLGIDVGGPAINATPRQMLSENILLAMKAAGAPTGVCTVTVSVPDGARLALRTFNPRLGVTGGISIIGTSGIVRPFSAEAFVMSIRKEMEVARATESPHIVINSGAKSERYLHARYPDLPLQAFVHYGNFIGDTVKIAAELHIGSLIMGLMIGKAVKLAEGHLDTHSKHTVMDRDFIGRLVREAGCDAATVEAAKGVTLARELWDIVPPDRLQSFADTVISHCHRQCAPLLPDGRLTVVLIAEDGRTYGRT